ncbi:hypothetical protein [Pedobacter miscanthi]|uniref:Uncharacterized protein n=1 Tax=Pedobacter miscanthi TaxID=2259170 RepID=A0A366L139_9SPHI|nr:hypothetical protein [Pedobacter miscanthi]RBQ07597.1 hypothetical protein DRW42_10435 [Pedobacter miscanthi]
MEKFNFSNEGFQNLQKYSYQKTDQSLEIEVKSISENFIKWITEKFILSDEQLFFLHSQNPKMIRFLAAQTQIAVGNRLPITLIKPATKPQSQQLDSKLIRPESNFTTIFHGNGKMEISGSLIIYIFYSTKNYPDFKSNASQKYNQQYLNQLF